MKKLLLVLLAQSSAVAWSASVSTIARQIGAAGDGSRLTFSADRMSVNAEAGTLSATGHVNAAFSPFRLVSDSVSGSIAGKDPANPYRTLDFGPNTMVTTCTNDLDHLHWCGFGTVVYRNHESGVRMDGEPDEFEAWNMSVRLWDVPVAWLPWAWKPLNTDYGFRFLPGYTSRWGTYLLSKYVYDLAGDTGENGRYGLGGSTRFDLRTKNGVALGQGLNWNLGDFGRGKFKVYYAWDDDADGVLRSCAMSSVSCRRSVSALVYRRAIVRHQNVPRSCRTMSASAARMRRTASRGCSVTSWWWMAKRTKKSVVASRVTTPE